MHLLSERGHDRAVKPGGATVSLNGSGAPREEGDGEGRLKLQGVQVEATLTGGKESSGILVEIR
jgi:hypothetical protein